MRVGEFTASRITIKESTVDGKRALQVGSCGGYLVQLDMESHEWTLVDTLASDIPFDTLKEKYGIWNDREVTSGKLFWKKTIRPVDGQIQRDEVKEFQIEYGKPQMKFDRHSHAPPVVDDRTGWFAIRVYDVLEPDAHVVLHNDGTGTIAVLEEKWTCTGEVER